MLSKMDYAEIKQSLEEQEEAIRRHNAQRQNALLKVPFDLEEGMKIYDKWHDGPFTDTASTERLENWVWDNIPVIFKLLNHQRSEMQNYKSGQLAWDLAVNLGREHGQRISLEKQIERQRQQILRALDALHRGNHDDAKRILEAM